MNLKVKKLDPLAKIPTRAHHDDAGMDVYSVEDLTLRPEERRAIRTGIAMAIPSGYVGLIWDKSGVAAKSGVKTMGGVIDAGYRGEIQVVMRNLSTEDFVIEKGSKIAQMLIQRVELPEIEEADELEDSVRGENAFGSTGKF